MLTRHRKVSLRLCLRRAAAGATDRVVGPPEKGEPQEGNHSYRGQLFVKPLRRADAKFLARAREKCEAFADQSSLRNDGTSRTSCETSKPSVLEVAGRGASSGAAASRRLRRRAWPPKPVAITVTRTSSPTA